MLSLDHLLSKGGGNIFRLVRLAMVRALEINHGKPPMVDFLPVEKETTIALREIAQGKLNLRFKELKEDN